MSPISVVGSSVFTENVNDLLYFCSFAGCSWDLVDSARKRFVMQSLGGGDGDRYLLLRGARGVGGTGCLVYNLLVNLHIRGTCTAGSWKLLAEVVEDALGGLGGVRPLKVVGLVAFNIPAVRPLISWYIGFLVKNCSPLISFL